MFSIVRREKKNFKFRNEKWTSWLHANFWDKKKNVAIFYN